MNLEFHLQDPVHAVSLIIQNIFNQGREWLGGTVGRFGYSYTLLPGWVVFMQFLAYILIVMVEKPAKVLSMKFRLPLLGITLLNIGAFLIGGFLIMSAIGANKIFGMQGRYFTPLLPYFFLSVFYLPFYTDREKWLRWAAPLYCILVLLYTQYFLDSAFYTA
jgi:uncharacterized membrane protein